MLPELQEPCLRAIQGDLPWLPNTLYALRDGNFVGEILAVSKNCLTGRIIRSDGIVWLNDEVEVQASSIIEATEWNFRGNNARARSYDLMTLIRRPISNLQRYSAGH